MEKNDSQAGSWQDGSLNAIQAGGMDGSSTDVSSPEHGNQDATTKGIAEFFESCRWVAGNEILAIFSAVSGSTIVHPFESSEFELDQACEMLGDKFWHGCTKDDFCSFFEVSKEVVFAKLNSMPMESKRLFISHLRASTSQLAVSKKEFIVSQRFQAFSSPESLEQLEDELLLIIATL